MTDLPTSDDELVSAYLDGAATPDEVARVEGDAVLLARAEAIRAAIEAVAAPVAIPEIDLTRIRAVAVAQSSTSPDVRDMMAAASAKRERLQRRNRVMAVAAAFVLLAVSVGGIRALSNRSGSGESTDAGSSTSGDDSVDTAAGDDGGGFDALGGADQVEAAEIEETLGSADDMAADAESDFDNAANDAADDDDDSGGDSGDDEADPSATTTVIPTAAKVLPATLDPVASFDELVEVVTATYTAQERAAEVLEPAAIACPDTFAEAFAVSGINFQSADYAAVSVNGTNHIVAVADQGDGTLLIVAATTFDCMAIALAP